MIRSNTKFRNANRAVSTCHLYINYNSHLLKATSLWIGYNTQKILWHISPQITLFFYVVFEKCALKLRPVYKPKIHSVNEINPNNPSENRARRLFKRISSALCYAKCFFSSTLHHLLLMLKSALTHVCL